jgi:SAM-dependent methyltransferase
MERGAYEPFRELFFERAPIFKKTFMDVEAEFGPAWVADFDEHLSRLLGADPQALEGAIRGYNGFSIDAMRLQRRFNRTKRYEEQTYEEACARVYLNPEYMKTLYLPGILVSQFVWRHHYRQLEFYRKRFLPRVARLEDRRFYDVGTGTGSYSVQLLHRTPGMSGTGLDISPSSREFTLEHVRAWNGASRFESSSADITRVDLEPRSCVQTIEVLEHLADPQGFLERLRRLLRPGGCGFVAAAITAPEADHIYLYWSPDDVVAQLERAGFEVLELQENPAYVGPAGEIVPKVAAFIVT